MCLSIDKLFPQFLATMINILKKLDNIVYTLVNTVKNFDEHMFRKVIVYPHFSVKYKIL